MALFGLLQWRPQLEPVWCGIVILVAGLWLYWLYRRLLRRLPADKARWLLLPKGLALFLLLIALFDPVSALEKKEPVKGKLLAVLDTSSSMDVADDSRESRRSRARRIVAAWRKSLPGGLQLDELEFDTALRKPGGLPAKPGVRGTDLGGCLLSLAERGDISSYLGVVLLTDGGDEGVESAVLPAAPLSIVGVGTDPATWNDVALTDVQAPVTAEKDVDFEISADLVARAGGRGGFAANLLEVHARLEHETGATWTKLAEQKLDLSNHRLRVKFPAKSAEPGIQRYRVTVDPVPAELSALNNTQYVTVDVQKKSLHLLYFTRELSQEFKTLRNEIGRDPGLTFTALIRTVGERFTLQGNRLPGDEALEAGFPSNKKTLEFYDAVIVGSFPAADWTPQQMQALQEYVDGGGAVVFLGGRHSFGRGGYARTPLAAVLPWRVTEGELEPALGAFSVSVPPVAAGHPILAGVEDLIVQAAAALESANLVAELKPGATPLLNGRVGNRSVALMAVQPYGQGKVLAIASNMLWKWATQPEPLPTAYGSFWRQALRFLTGRTEGGQNLAVKWDKDFYRPGEQATAEIRLLGQKGAQETRFTATLSIESQSNPLPVAPVPGKPGTFSTRFLFRNRGDYAFRLVAYQADRVLENYEKHFPVAPRAPEGSRLELDELFLKKLAERGGGVYMRENESDQLAARLGGKLSHKTVVSETSLLAAGPWFAFIFLLVLIAEWTLRRRINLV